MNTWPPMVSSRLLLFSPAIFMLIAVVVGQPAFDLKYSFCSSGGSDCPVNRTSDACFQYRLCCSSIPYSVNFSLPRVHLGKSHPDGSKTFDWVMRNTHISQKDRGTMIKKLRKNRISWRSLTRAAAAPGKESNTSRYVVLTVTVLLNVTSLVLLIVSTGIYIRAKMPRKNVESMTMGSQQKVGQATGTSQYSSKLQEALDKFDTGSNDSQPVSHFYCFDGYQEKFLRLTIPREGVPLLEKLRSHYGDFTAECRLGNMAGSMLLKLLSAVLLDIRRVPLKDLDITRVCEWRDALKEVLAAGFDVGFLLGPIRHMIVEFHNRPSEQELAELEATITKKEVELLELRARRDRLAAACSSFGVGSCFDHILGCFFNN